DGHAFICAQPHCLRADLREAVEYDVADVPDWQHSGWAVELLEGERPACPPHMRARRSHMERARFWISWEQAQRSGLVQPVSGLSQARLLRQAHRRERASNAAPRVRRDRRAIW